MLDAAVEDKGAVVRGEMPSGPAPDVEPTASGRVDLNLIDGCAQFGRQEAQGSGGATPVALMLA